MKAGWESATLGNVCDIISGAGFPKKHQGETDGEFPFFKVGDMNSEGNETHLVAANHYISEATRKALGARVLPPESVVFPKVGGAISTNKKRRLVAPSCVDNNVMGLTPDPQKIDPSYLAWWMDGVDIYEFSNKAALPSITKGTVDAWPIPLPPLEEQKRIVTVLDAAFEGLTSARTHIETNLQNARELFESFISERLKSINAVEYSLADLMEKGWITSHLDGNHGSNYPKKAEFISEGVPYISANCMIDGEIDLSLSKYLSEERADTLVKGTAFDQDVIFAHNATVGPVSVLTTTEPRVLLGTSVTHYRCEPEKIDPYFLCYEMRSAEFVRQYEAVMGQATRNQVPITIQRSFMHRIPSMADQRLLSETARKAEASTKELELTCRTKLQDLDDLRQSLLQKAFEGELT